MLVNAAVQYVLPASNIAASPRPASDAMAVVLGSLGAGIVSASMALSMLVAMNGTVMSGARVPFAVARDRYFFSGLAEVHPRFHTPSVAIVVQAILTIVLLLFGGNFRQFFSLAIFAEWLFYMIASSTVFVFRRRDPQAAATISGLGIPRGSCALCSGIYGVAVLHIHGKPSYIGIWLRGHHRRHPGFLCFFPAAPKCHLKNPGSNCFFSSSSILGLPKLLKDNPAGHVYPSPFLS